MPENDWWIPLTFSYIGAMKIIQSVIDGSNYQNTVGTRFNDLEATGDFWSLNPNVVKSNL